MIDNPCYNLTKKVMGHTIEEAKSNKKLSQRSFFNTLSGNVIDDVNQETSNVKSQIETDEPTVTIQGDDLSNAESSELMDESTFIDFKDDENQASTSTNMSLANVETIVNSLLTQQKLLSSHEVELTEIMEIVKSLSLDNVRTKNENFTTPHMSSIKAMPPKDEFNEHIKKIRSDQCISMASILMNPLVDGIFEVVCEKEESSESLVCEPCKKWSKVQHTPIKLGHEGSLYSVWKSGIKRPMEKWFSNLKISIFRHLISDSHHKCVDSEFGFQAINSSVRKIFFKI